MNEKKLLLLKINLFGGIVGVRRIDFKIKREKKCCVHKPIGTNTVSLVVEMLIHNICVTLLA
jgi:hypothetical protein